MITYRLSAAYIVVVGCMAIAIQFELEWLRWSAVVGGGILLAMLMVRR